MAQVQKVTAMTEPTASPDAVDRASAAFWSPTDLDTLLTGVEPLRGDESFTIPTYPTASGKPSRALHE